MTSKTILYITKFYDPTTTAAGIRAIRFVDALVSAGYRVIVLTFGQPSGLDQVDENLSVYRISENHLPEQKTNPWPITSILPGPDPDKAACRTLFAHAQFLIQK